MAGDDALTAFLATAEYHVGRAGEPPAEASESFTSTACFYAPRLLAAVKAVRKYHFPEYTSWGDVCGGCWTADSSHPVWPCAPMVDMVSALMGEGA